MSLLECSLPESIPKSVAMLLQEIVTSIVTSVLITPGNNTHPDPISLDGLTLSQMPSASEVTLTAFLSINPLAAARLISLDCTLSELLGLNEEEQRQLAQKLPDLPAHSLELFFRQSMYGQPITGNPHQLAQHAHQMHQQAQHGPSEEDLTDLGGPMGQFGQLGRAHTAHTGSGQQGFSSSAYKHVTRQPHLFAATGMQQASAQLHPGGHYGPNEHAALVGRPIDCRWQQHSHQHAAAAFDVAENPAAAHMIPAATHMALAAVHMDTDAAHLHPNASHMDPHNRIVSHANTTHSAPLPPLYPDRAREAPQQATKPSGNPFSGFSYQPQPALEPQVQNMQHSMQDAHGHQANAALLHSSGHMAVEEVSDDDHIPEAWDAAELMGGPAGMYANASASYCQQQQLNHQKPQHWHQQQHQQQQLRQPLELQVPVDWEEFLPGDDHESLQAQDMDIDHFGEAWPGLHSSPCTALHPRLPAPFLCLSADSAYLSHV